MNWLKDYITHKNISVLHFEKSIDTRSTIDKAIKNNSNLRSDILAKIIERYPDINPKWLVTGKGNMLKNLDNDFEFDLALEVPFLLEYLLKRKDELLEDESFRNYIKMNMAYIETDEDREKNKKALEKLRSFYKEKHQK
ncbi:conserved protein of unknown function [Tenacibaculum sp. 190524A02b]|uniref:hypothetical protein n=1 Tax=Tenacibaculum vairaonense TaxID=3137860 RepID=UPI0032B242D6